MNWACPATATVGYIVGACEPPPFGLSHAYPASPYRLESAETLRVALVAVTMLAAPTATLPVATLSTTKVNPFNWVKSVEFLVRRR